jgi:hypothetical protein
MRIPTGVNLVTYHKVLALAAPENPPETQKGEAGLPLLFYIPAFCVSFGAIRAPATAGF